MTEVCAHTKKDFHSSIFCNVIATVMGATKRGAMKRTAQTYTISDECNGCGTCSKVCPVANVLQSNDGKPSFGMNCESCYAFVHNCPQRAIHVRKERSGERFRNSEVTVKEIIEANRRSSSGGDWR